MHSATDVVAPCPQFHARRPGIPSLTSPRLSVSTPTVFMASPSTGRGVARYGCRGCPGYLPHPPQGR